MQADQGSQPTRGHLQQAWQSYLDRTPWTVFATLTFPKAGIHRETAQRRLRDWIREAEKRLSCGPLSWYAILEYQVRGALHLHVLLAGVDPSFCVALTALWGGDAKVEPFDEARRGAGINYVTQLADVSEPMVGGPAFGKRKGPSRRSAGKRRQRDQRVLSLRPSDTERELIDAALGVLRRKTGNEQKDGQLLAWCAMEFFAGRGLSLDQRVQQYERMLWWRSGMGGGAYVEVGTLAAEEMRLRVLQDWHHNRARRRFSLFSRGGREGGVRTTRGSQWDMLKLAIREAQRMSPGMTESAAVGWICLDVVLTWGGPKDHDHRLGGLPMWQFCIAHLGRLLNEANASAVRAVTA